MIELDEFTKFLKEKGIVNKTFPAKKVLKIFNCVQDDPGGDVEAGGGEGEEEEGDDVAAGEDAIMTYPEFLEALGAVGCFISPDPYVCLEQRLEVFFLTRIVDHITPKMVRKHKAAAEKKRRRAPLSASTGSA